MTTIVARLYRFRGIHSLPDFPPPWCHPHQHDYTVEVVARGGTETDLIDKRWEEILPAGSHWRNGAVDVDRLFQPSTVENIAEKTLELFGNLAVQVTVWEDQQRWGRAVSPSSPQE